MKCFILSAGVWILIDKIDTSIIQTSLWVASTKYKYLRATTGKYQHQYLHRIIAERMSLDCSNGIDHIDGNPLNNQRSNFRSATNTQNQMNSGISLNNTSGFKGVSYHKGTKKYQSRIHVKGKSIHLGLFDYAEQAHLYYCIAAIKHFGKFARFE